MATELTTTGPNMHLLRISIIAPLMIALITGCSNHHVLPDTGPEIKEVYERHIGGVKGDPGITTENQEDSTDTEVEASDRPSQQDRYPIRYESLSSYTRHPANEIDNLFPVLPNPQIVIYVYPHMTKSNRPIPGYSTATRLYDKDEYALPGEWVANHPAQEGERY